MICSIGTFELITDLESKPELTGDARATTNLPLLDLKAKIME